MGTEPTIGGQMGTCVSSTRITVPTPHNRQLPAIHSFEDDESDEDE